MLVKNRYPRARSSRLRRSSSRFWSAGTSFTARCTPAAAESAQRASPGCLLAHCVNSRARAQRAARGRPRPRGAEELAHRQVRCGRERGAAGLHARSAQKPDCRQSDCPRAKRVALPGVLQLELQSAPRPPGQGRAARPRNARRKTTRIRSGCGLRRADNCAPLRRCVARCCAVATCAATCASATASTLAAQERYVAAAQGWLLFCARQPVGGGRLLFSSYCWVRPRTRRRRRQRYALTTAGWC